MTYHRVYNKRNTMGATFGAGTAYPVLSEICVAWSLVFCVMFCRSLFVVYLLVIVLSVLWLMASDYPFGIHLQTCLKCIIYPNIWLIKKCLKPHQFNIKIFNNEIMSKIMIASPPPPSLKKFFFFLCLYYN